LTTCDMPTLPSEVRDHRLPSVLVTGFSVFPGAPANPTETLIPLIEAERDRYTDLCRQIKCGVLPVQYEGLSDRLARLSASQGLQGEGVPDIAIHFGLGSPRGVTLETVARNETRPSPDVTGALPPRPFIVEGGPDTLPSTLPLQVIAERLQQAGLEVRFSEDAGGYLCNYLFYVSASRSATPSLGLDTRPKMSGFIHVPPLRTGQPSDVPYAISVDELLLCSRVVIETCCESYIEGRAVMQPNYGNTDS
jgi:pyroglutamyl-peptidase